MQGSEILSTRQLSQEMPLQLHRTAGAPPLCCCPPEALGAAALGAGEPGMGLCMQLGAPQGSLLSCQLARRPLRSTTAW